MTREETVRNLLTELIDMIDNGSQRDLDRADEISKSILEVIEKEPCCNCIEFKRYAKQMGFRIEIAECQEPTTKNVSSELEKNSKKLEKGTTKNDLAVDDEERELALMYLEQIKEDYIEDVECERHPLPEYYAIETAIKSLALPSVRPKGHWIEHRDDYGEITHWHCSNCYDDSGFITTCKWDYCPNCGSDNREAVEE
jgi:GTPase SAR1 family protein